MTNSWTAAFVVSLAAVALAVADSAAAQAAPRPHIVLVMADDQGWGDMAYNGHPDLKTPNFDAAAAAGLRFDRFYAAAPVCSPTRASVLTGRHPNRMGVFQWGYSIRPQEVTLAEALKGAGYTTAHFGKWHVGSVRKGAKDNPGHNGFDEWLSAPNFYDNDAVMSRRGTAVPCQGESSMIAVDAAIAWMRRQVGGDAPMFTVVWFGSPHAPHRAVAEDRAHYRDKSAQLQNFYGEITGMDRAFGKLRDSLTELGIRDRTILWYCSDNGALPRVGNTGGARGRKGQVYDGGLLVPAILEWPAKIKQPRTTKARCNTCDIYPTVLELAGVQVEHQPRLDGVSLAGLVAGGAAPRRGMGFWNYPIRGLSVPAARRLNALLKAQRAGVEPPLPEQSRDPARLPAPPYPTDSFPGHAAWIEDDWKLHRIQDQQGKVRWECYHLAEDAAEAKECGARHPDRVARLRPRLESWLVSVVGSLNGADYR